MLRREPNNMGILDFRLGPSFCLFYQALQKFVLRRVLAIVRIHFDCVWFFLVIYSIDTLCLYQSSGAVYSKADSGQSFLLYFSLLVVFFLQPFRVADLLLVEEFTHPRRLFHIKVMRARLHSRTEPFPIEKRRHYLPDALLRWWLHFLRLDHPQRTALTIKTWQFHRNLRLGFSNILVALAVRAGVARGYFDCRFFCHAAVLIGYAA